MRVINLRGSKPRTELRESRMNGADGKWTPDNIAAMIGEPFYAVNIDPDLLSRTIR